MTAPVTTSHLIENMQDARDRTLELVRDLDEAQIIGPKLPIVNPLRWEIGHVAHFYEYFILRQLYNFESVLGERADQLYDSIAINHEDRWDLDLPTRAETLSYMQSVFDRLVERLVEPMGGGMATEQDSFIYQFGIFHEDMHTEAFLWARQALAYPTPDLAVAADVSGERSAGGHPGWAEIPGGEFLLGAPEGAPFAFDNEKCAYQVAIEPFEIAKAPVTNQEFQAFVDDGGYDHEAHWNDEGWAWRQAVGATHPVYWQPTGPANGCCDGSTGRSPCRGTNLLFTSAGTKPTPTAAGRDCGCRQRQNGKWRPSAKRQPTVPWLKPRGAIPGATHRRPLRAPTSMAEP